MILDTIVATKREEVALIKSRGISRPLLPGGKSPDAPRGFMQALLAYPGVSIIAEVKKASPSKGVICENFDPVAIARAYQDNGAQAISVLTDQNFFQGSLDYLAAVREAVKLPVLRKDFIIDPVQIEEAHIFGADAILLIAAILDEEKLRDFRCQAEEKGMDVLVEVHDEEELDSALRAGSRLIGVNNRNLKDFSVDIETTFRLGKRLPKDIPLVSESGLKTPEDMRRLASAGVAAALIGETLMRAGRDGDVLRALRGEK